MRLKVPPQGTLTIDDIIEYLKKTGALNVKYDANLDGIVDKAEDANTVGGHAPGTSAGDVLVLNTAGQVPLANIPLLPASQLGFSFAWEKVARVTSTGVASISFTGLAGDTDIFYLIVGSVVNPNTGGTGGIYIRYNADTTLGNYAFIGWQNDDGTVSTSVQTLGATSGTAGCPVMYLHSVALGVFFTFVKVSGVESGTTEYAINVAMGYDTGKPRYTNAGGHYKRSAEITEIELFTGAGAAINWDVTLFKPKW